MKTRKWAFEVPSTEAEDQKRAERSTLVLSEIEAFKIFAVEQVLNGSEMDLVLLMAQFVNKK